MSLTTREIVLATIKESEGVVRGKTLLQKRVYFLDILLRLDLGYRPHYYGPYSPSVEEALGELQALRFVEERQKGLGINEDGFEVRRYDYEITDDGEELVELLKKKKNGDYEKIAQVLQRIKDADEPDYLTLSVAAKTHYILTREGRSEAMTGDEIVKVGQELKWKISEDQLKEAVAFLERLGLVKSGS